MLIYIVILIISVILHELAHGYTAYSFGDSTAKDAGRLSPNPIKHIDPVGSLLVPFLLIVTGSSLLFGWAKPVPYNPYNLKGKYSEFFVVSAGIFLNIVVAVTFGLFYRFFGDFLGPAVSALVLVIVTVNLFLAAFNLLPIPPLDYTGNFSNSRVWFFRICCCHFCTHTSFKRRHIPGNFICQRIVSPS